MARDSSEFQFPSGRESILCYYLQPGAVIRGMLESAEDFVEALRLPIQVSRWEQEGVEAGHHDMVSCNLYDPGARAAIGRFEAWRFEALLSEPCATSLGEQSAHFAALDLESIAAYIAAAEPCSVAIVMVRAVETVRMPVENQARTELVLVAMASPSPDCVFALDSWLACTVALAAVQQYLHGYLTELQKRLEPCEGVGVHVSADAELY